MLRAVALSSNVDLVTSAKIEKPPTTSPLRRNTDLSNVRLELYQVGDDGVVLHDDAPQGRGQRRRRGKTFAQPRTVPLRTVTGGSFCDVRERHVERDPADVPAGTDQRVPPQVEHGPRRDGQADVGAHEVTG